MMNKLPPSQLCKRQRQAAFNKAAKTYDAAAAMQLEVGNRLFSRLDFIKLNPALILDIGASCGRFTHQLASKYQSAKVIGLDISENMCIEAKKNITDCRFINGDMEALPFANETFDVIFSNLTLQWHTDLNHLFSEVSRVLKPGGFFTFTTLGPDTLQELRQSWYTVDPETPHVYSFLDMHDVGDILFKTPFQDPVLDMEHITYLYPSVLSLMKEMQATGTINQHESRRNTLTGKSRLQKMIQHYETHYPTESRRIPVTYEIIYGHAFKPSVHQSKSRNTQESTFSLEEMRRLIHEAQER